MGDLKSQINTSFKLSGLTVRLEANKYLVGLLTPVSQEERQGWIDRIIDIVTDSNLKSNVIDKEILSSAVRQCTNQEAGKNDVQILNTINAFDVPRLCYNPERKKYLPDSFSKRSEPLLLAPADCKSRIFLDRSGPDLSPLTLNCTMSGTVSCTRGLLATTSSVGRAWEEGAAGSI